MSSGTGEEILDLSGYDKGALFDLFINHKGKAEGYRDRLISNDVTHKLNAYVNSREFQLNRMRGQLLTDLIPEYLLNR
ncbi:hypothetical protein SAMN05421788_11854 [Filimonas lacunae]|uniref:Uncharacterized protein n=1 Tax=Filimonas lacunae TaxID=477680 RepID=A0A173MBB7_9BACT|nr:hypothetical protein FLA_0826 [Filimonas lacunae]SIT34700.1 hypothetical protein SAMN05421788_11854 [Filimonas lacunae]